MAIIGRPNVGKSTLFNRLIGQRDAIVDDESGVTRDRQYGVSDWNGKNFNVVDTGGFVPRSTDIFEKAIREQVKIALDEASLVIFMVDVTCGITDLDDEVTKLLRRSSKPVLLAVNKVDNGKRELLAAEFYSMGFKETYFVSSITGSGTGELLDAVVEYIKDPEPEEDDERPRITIVGQPNVGKSSLLNAMVGEERNIVTDIAGTTRDTIHTHYTKYGKDFWLIDTAGLRKKAKMMENLEFYSVIRALRAIDEADVCLMMIDATKGVEAQDLAIYRLIQKKNKGVVVLVNKWDLVEKETNTARDFEKVIREKLLPFNDVPIIFVSALDKTRVFKAIDIAIDVFARKMTRISTSKLNVWLEESMQRHSPPSIRGKVINIKYVTQLPLRYPAFAFFSNYPKHVRLPYQNYLENRLREDYDFTGVPMRLYFRKK